MQENMNEQAAEAKTESAIGADGIYRTPQAAIDAVMANPPFGGSVAAELQDAPPPFSPESADGSGDKKSNLIGMSCGQNSILAWNFSEGLRVRVVAERKGGNCWMLTASYGDNVRMIASIFGGRWTADTYARLVRNALTAREKKIRRNHEKRKAKKAAMAAAETAEQAEASNG